MQQHDRPARQMCGIKGYHPMWMQRYANTRMFMAVYGLLGTIQATSYMYFVVTLTTIEKRFKIPSQTMGVILSGNEVSQILLSLILSYVGGQRNRPQWIAWGMVFCGSSCFILAIPHLLYGAGDDILRLTKEHLTNMNPAGNETKPLSLVATLQRNHQLCGPSEPDDDCDTMFSMVPLVLIFFSQFVLGVGNTLYYSLGQTYLDDNTKKTNTPLMLAVAMSLRMIGPILGFFLGYISLNMFIDPWKTPLIDNKDSRWLGAWWFGWIILGTLMVLFSGLIGLFPKQLPDRSSHKYKSHMPQALRHDDFEMVEDTSLRRGFSSASAFDVRTASSNDFPKLKDFPSALMRLLTNKLLIFNIVSGVFYILGATGYMTFLAKYMEVQFHRNAQSATIVVGPVSVIGMIVGFIVSGLVLSKKKPAPSKVLMWNVIVGCVYIAGQISYMFMYCGDSNSLDDRRNSSEQCNLNCVCGDVRYSPVCHELTGNTYYSPCHAGCHSWNADEKLYSNCSCIAREFTASTATTTEASFITESTTYLLDEETTENNARRRRRRHPMDALGDVLKPGVCQEGCALSFWTFSIASMFINWLGSSGRVGNILVNYRAVSPKDKSFAQGLSLMLVSLFALIPGPIIFGRIIDSTCLVWTRTCSGIGNCQLYDQTRFRYLVNITAFSLTTVGMAFDFLVWYYGRNSDLYGERRGGQETKRSHHSDNKSLLLPKK